MGVSIGTQYIYIYIYIYILLGYAQDHVKMIQVGGIANMESRHIMDVPICTPISVKGRVITNSKQNERVLSHAVFALQVFISLF